LIDSRQALATALGAGREAAQVHQRYLGRIQVDDWSEKGIADFVTHVDRDAESRIVDRIRQAFPAHDILAEEAASEAALVRNSDFLWMVDPLDGTTNFLHRYPMYCASVALLRAGEPIVAAVVCGATGEEWSALQGEGAFRNGEPIRVSDNRRLDRALIGTGFPFKIPALRDQYLAQFRRVMGHVSDIRRAGSAALDLCHLATGYFDGFWELDLQPWDFAAGVLIIREAGGIVTGLDGREPDWTERGGLIAGNPHLYPLLRDMLGN
jgi:myo-inositol-1(or 4)-monophosphatase